MHPPADLASQGINPVHTALVNPLAHISDAYRRWRHSRGFGVHSPFAYRIVTEALYPRHGYAYYIENDARLSSADAAEGRRARALYRLIILLRMERGESVSVRLADDAPQCWRKALRLAGARLVGDQANALCVVSRGVKPSLREPYATTYHHDGGCLRLTGRHWHILIKGRDMADTEYILP